MKSSGKLVWSRRVARDGYGGRECLALIGPITRRCKNTIGIKASGLALLFGLGIV